MAYRTIVSLFSLLVLLALPQRSPAEEPNACIQCHGSLPGRLGAPVPLWKKSIHAANAIACNDCHGGNPKDPATAMNPAMGFLGKPNEGDIPAFCGRCHAGVTRDYLQSAHGRAAGKGGPTCVTCHGNHLVTKATLDIINETRCTACHDYERAAAIKEAMARTEARIVAIDGAIIRWKYEGANTRKLEKELFAVRNRFHSLFHEINADRIRTTSAGIDSQLDILDRELKNLSDRRFLRRLAGAAAVGGALTAALLFHLLRKTYDE